MGSGGTPLTSKREYYDGGTIPWLQSGEVAQGEILAATNFITQAGLENSAARVFPPDTVLVAMYGATVGQVGILRFEATTNQAICGIFPDEKFNPKFLYYALLSKKSELVSRAVGNAQPNISQAKVKNTYVPLPSLHEQKCVVAILDKAFEGISIAIANVEKNIVNTRKLFENYLQKIFACPPVGWNKKPLLAVCKKITVGHVGSMAQRYQVSGIPFLRSQNVRPFDITMNNITFIDDTFHAELKKSQLCPGDLAVVRTGYPGTASVIPPWLVNANCSDLVIIRVSEELIPHYLEAFFNSNFGKKLVLGKLVGAAQKHFNVTAAKGVVLCYPPAREQATIVAEIKRLRVEIERLKVLYEHKIAALLQLKQSILRKTFAGELSVQPCLLIEKAAE